MIKVYIASPYTKGNPVENVERSLDVFAHLFKLGFAPFAPLLGHYVHIRYPFDYTKWMDLDLEWLEKCDAILRVPGESFGADREVAHARELNIPVFHDIETLCIWRAAKEVEDVG